MSYENAPATRLLASHCCICGRPLVDGLSVELGLGPECRKRHGYRKLDTAPNWEVVTAMLYNHHQQVTPETIVAIEAQDERRFANIVVNWAARNRSNRRDVLRAAQLIVAAGYVKLGKTLARRALRTLPLVTVTKENEYLIVEAPHNTQAILESRNVTGRTWDSKRKVKIWPMSSRLEVWDWLKAHYRGYPILTDRGILLIGGIQ
jgi:hypothetical protein